ncbi:cysteine-rich receptor-like protein kinase 44 [Hevea brasiliensis]|uniref:cysteine-rich receptor-like protein kinase 44 n=1 Tax=Hevea brasiliensis TaxID=3981 RepID=UPI0025F28C4B|nr:cysteine-rich receptor-like protein kinase 44 [Hevea brasiliensis]
MDNRSISLINFVSLLFHFLISICLTNALYCYKTGNFTTNSTYAKNRALVLSSLASNVTANGGFYTATVGQGTDKVYGLVLCRADTPSDACSKCVNTTITELIEKCPNQKEAISWGGDPPCIIRYANRSIFGLLELQPTDAGYNVNNITSNMEEFDQTWSGLMSRIVTKASMGSSKVKFATEEADLTPFQKIYALMLCTPDMSQSNCSYCLREAVGFYQSCCHGKQGGYVQKPNCIFRWDLYPFYNSIADALPPTPPPSISPPSTNNTISKENGTATTRTVVIITVPAIVLAALVALTCSLFYHRKSKQETKNLDENRSKECLKFNFETIRLATEDFSDHNKLGQGGFGAVYKGVLSDGQVVAVKRLSRNSKQEEVDFKNEVMLVARLQHRNLVRLLGFCFEGHERLLIYEYVPNSSLDHYIFDLEKRLLTNWGTRYKIIVGIARGILYLHEDSQLRIIHRDLKVSNILLDEEMNPKISDFGTARLFPTDQSEDATSKIVGTFGYMAPEYAFQGILSVKLDVFSFGVLILEIISGQKCNKFRNGEEEEERDLITYAWDNWIEGTASNIIDPILIGAASTPDILRCIQIGLLCVQADAGKRPTMASVVLMLDSCSVALPALSEPAYFVYSEHMSILSGNQSKSRSAQLSANQCSISELEPR